MNKQEIMSVLSELNKITGFRVSLHSVDYEEIAAYPENYLPFCAEVKKNGKEHLKCLECDKIACRTALESKKTHIYKCRFGLTEAVSPLYNFGTLTGFLMMGQVADSEHTRENVMRYAETFSSRNTDEASLCSEIPIVAPDMIRSYVKILTICAQYLTLSNAIPSAKPTVADMAKKYINENIGGKISIGDICHVLNCSKSTLLTTFKKQYGITVNTYITEQRLAIAVRLLSESNMTISEIAAETGFSDQSYFSKVFSAKYGVPPSEYRGGIRIA